MEDSKRTAGLLGSDEKSPAPVLINSRQTIDLKKDIDFKRPSSSSSSNSLSSGNHSQNRHLQNATTTK